MLRERDARRADHHELAQWIAFATHDPGKMPDFKPLADLAAPALPASDAADQARVRGYFIAAALASQTHKGTP